MTRKPQAIRLLQEFSIPLIAGVVIALIWVNQDAKSYEHFLHWSPLGVRSHFTFHFLVNDIFMVLFFGIAAKEITEATLPGGALNPVSKAINPLLATIGGVLGPIGVYFLWVSVTDDWQLASGWGIPTATDIALAWLVARLIFGQRHPAISFLLLLAVADDGIGLAIIAVFYPDPENPVQPMFLALVAAAMLLAWVLRKKHVHGYVPYLLGPGVLSWFGLYLAHLHPALALVVVVPFMPAGGGDEGLFMDADFETHTDTLNCFERELKLPVDLGLLGFGVANAGVVFSSIGNATWAVLASLIVGKTVGVFLFSSIGAWLGFPLPHGMNKRTLLVVGFTASLGLTVALFVAGEAFTNPALQAAAKMGALGSAVVAPLAIFLARVLRVRPEPEPTD